VTTLIKGLLRTLESCRPVAVYFLSASPPQIGAAIREKLDLDGIRYDGITFKDQMRHLMYARFDAVLEHIGYKLEGLLVSARESVPGRVELLFGDDWESDPFVYSLYADVLEGRLTEAAVAELLQRAEVSKHYRERLLELVAEERPRARVGTIFILRQRPATAADLDGFGKRLVWFDNYFECALKLWEIGALDVKGVFDVLADMGLDATQAATAFEAVCSRARAQRAALAPLRRALVRCGAMNRVARAPLGRTLLAALRRRLTTGSLGVRDEAIPDYARLVDRWSHRGRKEAVHDPEQVGRSADDSSG